jgi:EAL domain-containing protein (putative c-di-GMP-specific phosphodiesterase class I)
VAGEPRRPRSLCLSSPLQRCTTLFRLEWKEEQGLLSAGRQKAVAVVAGVLLASAGLLAFNHWLERLGTRQAKASVELAAERKLALAENRIDRVMATLDDLMRKGVEGCRPPELDVLRRAVFSNVMIKDISVIGPDGGIICTTSGLSAGSRRLLASQKAVGVANALIEVFDTGNEEQAKGRIVEIRRTSRDHGVGLGALLLGSTLIAQNSTETDQLVGYSRLTIRDGPLIGESGRRPLAAASKEAPLIASLSSRRYGLNVRTSLSQTAVAAHVAHVEALGSAIEGAFAIGLLVFFFFIPRRQRENPITELERALRAGEFVPYYQPVVDLVSGKLRGAEVLVRWRKPDGSIVSPGAFIPLAESSGIILDLTRSLMRRVCQEMGPAFAERPHLKVSFNLAAQHFKDETIVRDVRDIFGRGSVRLSQLVLELTERQPIENLVETRRLIASLQGLGVRMAIDDVGTGHSGLSYILKLGVDIIKIDKMFIDAIGIERSSTTIIETLIDLAHNMRMEVVAEGVENFEQVVCLRERGVRAAQGFVFAPALPGSSFLQLIEAIDPLIAATAVNQTPGLAVA